MAEIAARQAVRPRHLARSKMDFELDVVIAVFLVGCVGQVGQRRGLVA